MSFHLVFLGLVTTINLSLALFVLFRNPHSWVNRSFALFAGTLAFWTISMAMLLTAQIIIWSDLTLMFGNVIGIASFILFVGHFPEKHNLRKNHLIYGFIIPTSFFLLTLPFRPYVSAIIVTAAGIEPIIGPLYPILMLWSIAGAIYGSAILILKYKNSNGKARNQIKYLFWGFVIFLTSVTLAGVILPGLGFSGVAFYSPGASLALVIATSYAIVKHRLLDIRFIIVRSVAFLLLMLFIALGYIAALFNFAFFFNRQQPSIETLQSLILPAALAVFFAVTFQPLRRFFEKLTDKVFYRDRYDSNDLLWSMSRIMASTLLLSDLTKQILAKLLQTMKINYGSIVLVRDKSIFRVDSDGDVKNHPFKNTDIYTLIYDSYHSTKHGEHIFIFEELPEAKIKRLLREQDLTIVIPLTVRKELIGGLLLGHKSSGEIYSSEDVEVLKILAPEIAVAVRNALSYEEIKKFNITLEEEVDRATTRLRSANRRLKELDQLKDEFVSIASHELRTPMTAIKSYLWMALNQPNQTIKEPLKKYLDISYNSTERLIRLVNDMLTVSRIERNKIELKKEPTDMTTVVQLLFDELKITADEKEIKFTFDHPKSKMVVNGDKEKLREVIQNIVGNALKFTPEKGSIRIVVKTQKNTVHVAITDTASGIPKDSIDKLFQKFSKIEYSYSKHSSQPGTGLGLYISKKIISLHNGDIEVQSEVGVGSTFTVILPLYEQKKGGGES